MSKQTRRVVYPDKIMGCSQCSHCRWSKTVSKYICCHEVRRPMFVINPGAIHETCPLDTKLEVCDE